jgi:hypothetical protein
MWKISSATAQGQVYFDEGRNNQDVATGLTNGSVALGVINDGCHGEKIRRDSKNEVGALLSNQFLIRECAKLLLSGTNLQSIPELIFPKYIDYLNWQVESQFFDDTHEVNYFIANYLMCTTFGLIANESEVCVFWAGDGVIYLNDRVHREVKSPITGPDKKSTPKYPAYHLYERYDLFDEVVHSLLPDGFQIETFPAETVSTLGISSDGLIGYPNQLNDLKTYSQSNFSLQACLNRIAVIRSETSDNVSVVFLNKVEA